MSGKERCKILKEIRRQIAENNDIDYVVSECKYQGECVGTCPKCEAELVYLENELKKRKTVGKTILVAGLAATLMAVSSGCSVIKDAVDMDNYMTKGIVTPPKEIERIETESTSSIDEYIINSEE